MKRGEFSEGKKRKDFERKRVEEEKIPIWRSIRFPLPKSQNSRNIALGSISEEVTIENIERRKGKEKKRLEPGNSHSHVRHWNPRRSTREEVEWAAGESSQFLDPENALPWHDAHSLLSSSVPHIETQSWKRERYSSWEMFDVTHTQGNTQVLLVETSWPKFSSTDPFAGWNCE